MRAHVARVAAAGVVLRVQQVAPFVLVEDDVLPGHQMGPAAVRTLGPPVVGVAGPPGPAEEVVLQDRRGGDERLGVDRETPLAPLAQADRVGVRTHGHGVLGRLVHHEVTDRLVGERDRRVRPGDVEDHRLEIRLFSDIEVRHVVADLAHQARAGFEHGAESAGESLLGDILRGKADQEWTRIDVAGVSDRDIGELGLSTLCAGRGVELLERPAGPPSHRLDPEGHILAGPAAVHLGGLPRQDVIRFGPCDHIGLLAGNQQLDLFSEQPKRPCSPLVARRS